MSTTNLANMGKHRMSSPPRKDFILAAVDKIMVGGYVLEFGVGAGYSLQTIATAVQRNVYGFDSFEGLPENWAITPHVIFAKGSFKYDPPDIVNTVLVPGWFEDSIPQWKEQNAGPIAFIHIDSDLYSSCITILAELNDQIIPGTILLFDELLEYHNWEEGEWKALQEWLETHNRKVFQLDTYQTQATYRVIK